MAKGMKIGGAGARQAVSTAYFLSERERCRHGVDVGKAMRLGLVTQDDFRALLAFCRECADGSGRHDTGREAPAECPNQMLLEGLRGIV
ncbi:MAG: hypothetical protein KDE03_16620 [Rhodobacteraceae bacterium]|nr:hypothetical protein [Paracoccaceae bacterium]